MISKEKMPKVSVVVPVYNKEKYLEKCLDSLKKQTLSDMEIIVIDDGSDDSSGELCDCLSKDDCRIKVFHVKNGGVSKARNIGISKARGSFIGFVDGDDWIEPNMFELLYENAIRFDSDVSICGCFGEKYRKIKSVMTGHEAAIVLHENNGFQGYSCNKLVRRRLFESCRYDENLNCYEDIVLFHEIFMCSQIVTWINLPLYHYCKNETSITCSYRLSQAKRLGLLALERLLNDETDCKVRNALERHLFLMYLDYSIDYIVHGEVDGDSYHFVVSHVLSEKKWVRFCSFKQSIWRQIVLHDSLKKLYWWSKGGLK